MSQVDYTTPPSQSSGGDPRKLAHSLLEQGIELGAAEKLARLGAFKEESPVLVLLDPNEYPTALGTRSVISIKVGIVALEAHALTPILTSLGSPATAAAIKGKPPEGMVWVVALVKGHSTLAATSLPTSMRTGV
jgi:hypothetical protein